MPGMIPDPKPYSIVRLLCRDDGNLNQCYEVRVSIFVQFDENPGRRDITRHPSKAQAEQIAKNIARVERDRIGGRA